MAIQISSILGWKKGTRSDAPKIDATNRPLASQTLKSVSIIPAYNLTENNIGSDLVVNSSKTIGTVMIRRAQMLQ